MRSCFEHQLRHAWHTRGWLSVLLWPLSLLYGMFVRGHHNLYRWGWRKPQRLSVPVVVVGNVLAGGVGKTPLVMALVAHFAQQGLSVGVVSRGHGRSAQARQSFPICEVTNQSLAQQVGDEPLLIRQRCQVPVWVGKQRVEVARALLKAHPEVQVIISDDGLQHAALARDIELVAFDERGIGNGWLLPAGPLREPWPRRQLTHPVHRFVLSSAAKPPMASETAPSFQVQRRLSHFAMQADGNQRELSHWAQHPAYALAGIAKPHAFFAMLQRQGVQLARTIALSDHADAQALHLAAQTLASGLGDVLCTEKDAVKLWPTFPQAWAVPLAVELPAALLQAIDHALAPRLAPHGLRLPNTPAQP